MPVDQTPTPPPARRDWPVQAADAVVDAVDRARSLTTDRAVVAARAAVFGVVIMVLALIAGVTGLVGIVRATQWLLGAVVRLFGGELPHHRAVWISYVTVGAVFLVAGLVAWRRANRAATSPSTDHEEQR